MGSNISPSFLPGRKDTGARVRVEQHDPDFDRTFRAGRFGRSRAWNIGVRVGRRAHAKPGAVADQVLDLSSRDAVEHLLSDRSLALVRLALGPSRDLIAP